MTNRAFRSLPVALGLAVFAISIAGSAQVLRAEDASAPHCLWDLGSFCSDVNCAVNDGECVGDTEETCECVFPE